MSELHSSSTTPTPASFSVNTNSTSSNSNSNNTSFTSNTASSPPPPSNVSKATESPNNRPTTPSSASRALRSAQATLSPASACSEMTASSDSVRFSPFPSPTHARLRGVGNNGDDVVTEANDQQATRSPVTRSPASQVHHASTTPAVTRPQTFQPVQAAGSPQSSAPAPGQLTVSPGTKVSQFQLQPPKVEFKPSNSFPSLSSMPSLTASDSTASLSSAHSAYQLQSQQEQEDASLGARTPNVYINGLPPHFPEDQLFALTAPFGPVKSVRSFTRHVGDRASGYGFVLFEDIESAQRCIDSLKQYKNLHPSFSKQIHKIPGTPYFHMANAASAQNTDGSQGASADDSFKHKMCKLADQSSTNLYMEGLPLSIDEASLAALVEPHAIKSSRMFQTKLSDPPRVIAFVRLESRQAAEEVIERLHGRMVRGWNDVGSRISVRFADTSEQRELRRTERNTRDEDVSPNRLTIAQAALLNLHGQDVTMRPRVRRHPGPVTSATARVGLPASSSLPVIGTKTGHSPLSASSSLPSITLSSTKGSLPVIGSRNPPATGQRQQEVSQDHGSTLPVHPQIAAFNTSMAAARQPRPTISFDGGPQDVLDLSGASVNAMGRSFPSAGSLSSIDPESALAFAQERLALNALHQKQQQILQHQQGINIRDGVSPFWDEQIQALRRNGVPFMASSQNDLDLLSGDGGIGHGLGMDVLLGAGATRSRNGYTPAEEAILRAHTQKIRQLGGGVGRLQTSQVDQQNGSYRQGARVLNPFADEERHFHEHHARNQSVLGQENPLRNNVVASAGARQRKDFQPSSSGTLSLHANGQFSRTRETPSSSAAAASISQQSNSLLSAPTSNTNTTTTTHTASNLPSLSALSQQQLSQKHLQSQSASSSQQHPYHPHLRASTQPHRGLGGLGKHLTTNSLSVSIPGVGVNNAAPTWAPPPTSRTTLAAPPTSGNGTKPASTNYVNSQLGRSKKLKAEASSSGQTSPVMQNTADAAQSAKSASTAQLSSTPAPNASLAEARTVSPKLNITTTASSPPTASSGSAKGSQFDSQQSQAHLSAHSSQASGSYDSPLNSPALTYSSSSASLSPATPYFGSFPNAENGFQSANGHETQHGAAQQQGKEVNRDVGEVESKVQVHHAHERLPVHEGEGEVGGDERR